MEHSKDTPCDKEKVSAALNDWLTTNRMTALQVAEKHEVTIQCLQKTYEAWRQKGNR